MSLRQLPAQTRASYSATHQSAIFVIQNLVTHLLSSVAQLVMCLPALSFKILGPGSNPGAKPMSSGVRKRAYCAAAFKLSEKWWPSRI